MTDHHIHISGEKNTGKSQASYNIEELAERIRNLEEEVEGVEPPKSREEKRIDELEEKIDRLLMADQAGSWSEEDEDIELFENTDTQEETEDEERYACEYCGETFDSKSGKNGHEYHSHESQEQEARTATCKHCGGEFDNRGIGRHEKHCEGKSTDAETEQISQEEQEGKTIPEIMREDLSKEQRKVLDRYSTTNYKASSMMAKGFENLDQKNIQAINKVLSDKGLTEGKRGKGVRLNNLGKQVQEADEIKMDFPAHKTLSPGHYELEERKRKVAEILEQSQMPLTRHEIGRKLYKLSENEDIETADGRYTRVESVIGDLHEDGLVRQNNDARDTMGTPYELVDDSQDSSDDDESEKIREHSVSEQLEWEDVKKNAGVRDQDIDVVKLVFDKLVNQQEREQISYHDFEQHYSGEEKPLRMFQKLFNTPKLLEGVRTRICDDKDFKWKKHGNGKHSTGAENWVIHIE